MSNVLTNWWNKIGDRYPQLWRELQGRWRWPSILMHLCGSLVLQLWVVYRLYISLPSALSGNMDISSRYGTGIVEGYSKGLFPVLADATGQLIINWPLWWLDVFTQLSVLSVMLAVPTGIVLLLINLNQEERRGTLELIRLSPQRPQDFLDGKLWGVPSLIYLGMLAAVPLHLWAATQAGINLYLVFMWYAVVGCTSFMLARLGLLLNHLFRWAAGFQSFLIPAAIFLFLGSTPSGLWGERLMAFPLNWSYLFSPLSTLPSTMPESLLMHQQLLGIDMSSILISQSEMRLFIWPIGDSIGSLSLFIAFFSLLASLAFQQMLSRAIQRPGMPLLSRRSSYAWLLVAELLILGLAASPETYLSFKTDLAPTTLSKVMTGNFWLFLLVLGSLLPSRAIVQDWARYRRSANRLNWREICSEYLLHDCAPALPAIGLHLLLMGGATLFWVTSTHSIFDIYPVLVSLPQLLVYGALAQLIMVWRKSNGGLWASMILGLLIVVQQYLILSHPSLHRYLFSYFYAPPEVLGICTGLLAVAGLLQWLAHRQIQRLGASEWQRLNPSTLAKG